MFFTWRKLRPLGIGIEAPGNIDAIFSVLCFTATTVCMIALPVSLLAEMLRSAKE